MFNIINDLRKVEQHASFMNLLRRKYKREFRILARMRKSWCSQLLLMVAKIGSKLPEGNVLMCMNNHNSFIPLDTGCPILQLVQGHFFIKGINSLYFTLPYERGPFLAFRASVHWKDPE